MTVTGPRSFKASIIPKAGPQEALPRIQFFDGTAYPDPEFREMLKGYTAAAKTLPKSGPGRASPWPRTIDYEDGSHTRHPFPKFRAAPVTADEREWIGAPVLFRRWHAHRLALTVPEAAIGDSYSDEERQGTVISKAPGAGLWWVLDLSERKFYAMPGSRLTRRGPGMGDLVKVCAFE